jgi:hypothetical protein
VDSKTLQFHISIVNTKLLESGGQQVGNTIEVKQAAILANAHAAQVYLAIRCGVLESTREGSRVFIVRESFERWRKRLEMKRKIRAEERQNKN